MATPPVCPEDRHDFGSTEMAGGVGAEAGASAPAPPQPSLDRYGHSGTGVRRSPLTRQQKRCFQRLKSLMHFWVTHGFQIRWVTLTTRDSVQNKKLAYDHKRLRQRIASVHDFKGLQFVQVFVRAVTRIPLCSICTSFGRGRVSVLSSFRNSGSRMSGGIFTAHGSWTFKR